jgi:outer membrane protein assembly factor BamA
MKYALTFCFVLFFGKLLLAQSNTYNADSSVIIEDIIITGNKKTRNFIILREMVFAKGDTILKSQLNDKLLQSKQLIFNTTLFVTTDLIAAQGKENNITIIIDVKERWYIFPLPYFKWVDRNFNEWWTNQKASLDRVNYGLKFFHNNLTGRNDRLNINLITGYTRQTSIKYEMPFFDRKLQHGFSVSYTSSKQKEVNYLTSNDNKQLFFKQENQFTRNFISGNLSYTYRPDQYWRHFVRLSYVNDNILDTVAKLNPNYFGNGRKSLSYGELQYGVQYINTDFIPYPTKGLIAQASVTKTGFDANLNLWQLRASAMYAFPIKTKGYGRVKVGAASKFPTNNIFINQQLFGYGDFTLRGQDLLVVDGMAGVITQLTLGHEIFKFNIKTPLKNKAYQKIPFKVYAKLFSDFGYSYNPNNRQNILSNQLMRSWGFGLDILSIYDFVFRIEYGFNQFGNGTFVVNTGL